MSNTVSNLPVQTTALIGREPQIEEVCGLLVDPDCCLLTLVGPGGIGKTRLAVAVAQALPPDHFEDGVVFVPLQGVSSADLMPAAIADVAGITLAGVEPLPVQLVNLLRRKRLLLMLDNFEHLLDETDLLLGILREAPGVKLLITSREALSLREEWLFPVPGLPVPASDEKGDPAEFGAVQLFAERAQQVRRDFNLADETEAAISICRMTEGMPLAIELAASWLTVLDCATVAERLRHSLDILTTPLRNLPERHRSMGAIFDHSWQMLDADERNVFSRLSVFQGGFTFESAEEVAGATLPILSALVSKCLVRREADGRCQIHELLRQYGAEKLVESPEAEAAAHSAHSAFYMQLLADRQLHFYDSRQLQAAQEIGSELENVRKAWNWALDHHETEWIRNAGRSIQHVFQFQSRYVEGVDLFFNTARRLESDQMTAERGAALAEILTFYGWLCIRLGRLDDADRALARACNIYDEFHLSPALRMNGYPFMAAMFLALARGDYKRATTLGEQVLRVAAQYNEPFAATIPHYGMASAALAQGDYARAKAHAEQSLALAVSAGDRRKANYPHVILGQVALGEGDLLTARQHFQAAYALCDECGEPGGIAQNLANLAEIALLQQKWHEARRLYARSHAVYEEIGDRGGIARTLLGLGISAEKTDEPDAARSHFGAALAVAQEAQITPIMLSIVAAVGDFLLQRAGTQTLGLRALTFVLGHPSCDGQTRRKVIDSLTQTGRSPHDLPESSDTMESLTAALQVELSATVASSLRYNLQTQPLVEPLTERELEVLRLLAKGRSNPEIAKELIVAVGTVKAHTSNIFRKLDVANRTQAVAPANWASSPSS